ncbi:hypothetical protein VSQ48_22170 [Candidatus Ventrimonas sp. KK005]
MKQTYDDSKQIAWEAKKQGVSYGMFSAMLTEDRNRQIYKAYESYLKEKQAAEKRRLKKHKTSKAR